MKKGLNFRTEESQALYFKAFDESLKLISVPFREVYVQTSFGLTHCLLCGDKAKAPLILIHAASCSSTIWYKNVKTLSESYCIYMVDLITESSKSIMTVRIKDRIESANWLNEVFNGLGVQDFYLCGLSIGGWHSCNYAIHYPDRIKKLILISPIQTFPRMYFSFFFKIMKMGFHPTRENVENYVGWGSEKEAILPDSIINLFIQSVMNVNSNAAFPKMIKARELKKIKIETLIMLGENEFAFDIHRAQMVAKNILKSKIEIIKEASHLIPVSKPQYINSRILIFLEETVN